MKEFKPVPFVSEVEQFNNTFGKLNNYEPTMPPLAASDFVHDFIIEEASELKEAYEAGDIIGVFDALLDITYVSTGNGAMTFGLMDKFQAGYAEVHRSNMSKSCATEAEAEETVKARAEEFGEPCHYKQIGDRYVVYRSRDNKVLKALNYSKPDLRQFFTQEELDKVAEDFKKIATNDTCLP